MIELDSSMHGNPVQATKISIMGVGGAGNNTVNYMVSKNVVPQVKTIAVNTDAQALRMSHAHHVLQIGMKTTRGLGAGAQPEIGKKAAEEDIAKILQAVEGSDVVFLTGGLGGGTGSGALPVIARALKDNGILTIAVVTKPFDFEGRRRAQVAERAAQLLNQEVDTLMVMPNQRLLSLRDKAPSMLAAFGIINERIQQFVSSICHIILQPGYMNVDFADVKAVMQQTGQTVMGIGCADGQDRAELAVLDALSSPLLEQMHIEGARGILLNVTADESLGLAELETVASTIQAQAHPDALIILGSVIDQSAGNDLTVTVVATGFGQPEMMTAVHPSMQDHRVVQESLYSREIALTPGGKQNNGAVAMSTANMDTSDLEVPTLLRKLVQEKQLYKSE